MSTRQAIVLARGLGTRMRAADPQAALTPDQQRAADAGSKALMPICGRPFLDYVLTEVADAGIRRVGLVVAPAHDLLAHHYRAIAPPTRIGIEFVVQLEPRGTADAVLAAEEWTGGEPFLVLNGDNLYPAGVLRNLAALDEPGLPGFRRDDLVRSGNIPDERVASFALLQTNDAGYLTAIVEKPPVDAFQRAGADALVSMNCWRFARSIFQACRDVPISARGELELPAAVGLVASRGAAFRVLPSAGPVLDLSNRADAAGLTARLERVHVQL
jgi:glucose-1-phosphate thymidylyltransferase